MLERLRDNTALESEGWVQRGSLRQPVETALAGKWVPVQLWRLLILNRWLERALPDREWPGKQLNGDEPAHASGGPLAAASRPL
jgi:hypothetical protein